MTDIQELFADLRQTVRGEENVSIGTGYLVTSRHVLTARHVVRDRAAKVEVRFPPERGKNIAEVIWEDEALDVCILELAKPRKEPWTRWIQVPSRTTDFASTGFPMATAINRKREPCFFQGQIYPLRNSRGLVQVAVDDPPKEIRSFSGFSGAPVLVRGSIAGIVVEALDKFDSRLYVRPAADLFEDPIFCRKLGVTIADIKPEHGGSSAPLLTDNCAHDVSFDRVKLRLSLKDAWETRPSKLSIVPIVGEDQQGHRDFSKFCEHVAKSKYAPLTSLGLISWPDAPEEPEVRLGELSEKLQKTLRDLASKPAAGERDLVFIRHKISRLVKDDVDLISKYSDELWRQIENRTDAIVTFELHLPAAKRFSFLADRWSRRIAERCHAALRDFARRHRLPPIFLFLLEPITFEEAELAMRNYGCQDDAKIQKIYHASNGYVSRILEHLEHA